MDTDVVAVRDPFPPIRARLAAAAGSSGAVAAPPLVLASVDGRVPDEALTECGRYYSRDIRWRSSSGTSKLCGGLFFVRAAAATRALAADWEARVGAPDAGKKNQANHPRPHRHLHEAAASDAATAANRPRSQHPLTVGGATLRSAAALQRRPRRRGAGEGAARRAAAVRALPQRPPLRQVRRSAAQTPGIHR